MTPPNETRIPALDQLGHELRIRVEERASAPRSRVRLAMTAAVAVVLLATFLVATPQGRAVADWVGRLIGISDDSKPETLDQRLSDAVVIGEGAGPSGATYSVYADQDSDEGLCFTLVWAEPALRGFGTCQQTGIQDDVAVPFIRAIVPDVTTVGGLAPALTARVEVSYELSPGSSTETAPSQVFTLDDETRDQLDLPAGQTYALFVAFIPQGVGDISGPSTARVTAYSRSDVAIGRSPIEWAKTDIDDPFLSMVSCTDGNTVTERYCRGESP